MIESVLDDNASRRFFQLYSGLKCTRMLFSRDCLLLYSKKVNLEFVNKNVFCSFPFFKMNALFDIQIMSSDIQIISKRK